MPPPPPPPKTSDKIPAPVPLTSPENLRLHPGMDKGDALRRLAYLTMKHQRPDVATTATQSPASNPPPQPRNPPPQGASKPSPPPPRPSIEDATPVPAPASRGATATTECTNPANPRAPVRRRPPPVNPKNSPGPNDCSSEQTIPVRQKDRRSQKPPTFSGMLPEHPIPEETAALDAAFSEFILSSASEWLGILRSSGQEMNDTLAREQRAEMKTLRAEC